MAVTKRTRYEVLRRDGHRCRYCGTAATDGARLTVDHVVPIALGGSDESTNLAAACTDCNSGKASTVPDAPLVADVDADTVRWASAMRQAMETQVLAVQERTAYRDAVIREWEAWDKAHTYLPGEFYGSIAQWHRAGVPVEVAREAVNIAWGARSVPTKSVFRYMCGVVWRTLDQMQEAAVQTVKATEPGAAPACGHCLGCRYPDLEPEGCSRPAADWAVCPYCDRTDCLYGHGFSLGQVSGYEAGIGLVRSPEVGL